MSEPTSLQSASLQQDFKRAMRGFASAVSVITVSDGQDRSGFTATSVASFSVQPPIIVVSTKQTSSSALLLQKTRRFGVNLLRIEHEAIARRFTGFSGEQGASRYGEHHWTQGAVVGTPLLADSLVALDCEVDELLERHGQLLIFGRVHSVQLAAQASPPLIYWQGQYTQLAPHQEPSGH